MRVLDRLKDLVGQWPDPYEYECTVCDRSFQAERSTCPDCGGAVTRAETSAATPADPQP